MIRQRKLTTFVPNTHQISYKKSPERRMQPVENESIFPKESTLCANESPTTLVSTADFVVGEKIAKQEGMIANGRRIRDGVRRETFSCSACHK